MEVFGKKRTKNEVKSKALHHQKFLNGLTSLHWISCIWRRSRLSGTCNVGTVKYCFCNDSEQLPASPYAGAFTPAPLSQDSVGDGDRTVLEMEKVKETGWVSSVPSTECSK